jgi:hypothetical protein
MKRYGQVLLRVLLGIVALLVRTAPSEARGLVDLRGVDTLRARFNEDRGAIRIVLLLSPT